MKQFVKELFRDLFYSAPGFIGGFFAGIELSYKTIPQYVINTWKEGVSTYTTQYPNEYFRLEATALITGIALTLGLLSNFTLHAIQQYRMHKMNDNDLIQ